MLSRYASIVKNLRGVVLLDVEEGEEGVRWLRDRFKYRNLGVPPATLEEARGFFEGKLGGRPFVELAYPSGALAELARALAEALGEEFRVVEGIVLASAYVSPVLVVGRRAVEGVARLATDFVESRLDMDLRQWKLHLRIADYTVLDLYRWSTEHAEALLEGRVGLQEFRREREARIRRDKARYWRLTRAEGAPWKFLFYIDLASKLDGPLLERVRGIGAEASAGLGIEAAVAISPRVYA
ncbi:MAG: hypothetical protein QXT74_01750 [Candidatus Nezhaarchaeales archaeon]